LPPEGSSPDSRVPSRELRDASRESQVASRESRVGVLISGRGSNLQALIDAAAKRILGGQIAIVISNKANAAGLDRARAAGLETLVLDHRPFASRDDYDTELARILRARGVSLVCLAVHPSLLPAFPGVDAQRQALEHGVKVSGATVHLVTGELDGGPIVLQSAVPVRDDDTVDFLSERILIEEHRIYPEAVRIILDGQWQLEGRRFRLQP
jgi:phosphoribosylglycinamide formyltransferase 1